MASSYSASSSAEISSSEAAMLNALVKLSRSMSKFVKSGCFKAFSKVDRAFFKYPFAVLRRLLASFHAAKPSSNSLSACKMASSP